MNSGVTQVSPYRAAAEQAVGWKKYIPGIAVVAFLGLLAIGGTVVMEDVTPLLMLVVAAVVLFGVLKQRSVDIHRVEGEMALRFGTAGPRLGTPQAPPPPTHTRYRIAAAGRVRDDVLTEIRIWASSHGGMPVADLDFSRYTSDQLAQLSTAGVAEPNGSEYLIQTQIGLDPNRRMLAELARAHPDWLRGATPEETQRVIAFGEQHPDQLVQQVLSRHPEWSGSPEGSRVSAESLADMPRVFTILTRQEPPGSGPFYVYAAGCVVVGSAQKPFLENPPPTEFYRRKGWDEMADLRRRLEARPAADLPPLKTCSRCGHVIEDIDMFCAGCGAPAF